MFTLLMGKLPNFNITYTDCIYVIILVSVTDNCPTWIKVRGPIAVKLALDLKSNMWLFKTREPRIKIVKHQEKHFKYNSVRNE